MNSDDDEHRQIRRLQRKAANQKFRANNPDYWKNYHAIRQLKRPGYHREYYLNRKERKQCHID
jgi:hypothetical protein